MSNVGFFSTRPAKGGARSKNMWGGGASARPVEEYQGRGRIRSLGRRIFRQYCSSEGEARVENKKALTC